MENTTWLRMRAIILIQKWFRRYKAHLEARRRAAWMVYQRMEYSSEASLMHLCEFFNDVLQQQSGASASPSTPLAERLQRYGDRDDQKLLAETQFENISIETTYCGPHISFPLTAAHVHLMIGCFKRGERLHVKYLLQLLHETRLLLKAMPNIRQVSTGISKQVTVVGDLHGQLDDLLIVFFKNGLPDVTNPYVFNGDFVDRGPKSVEVVTLLFACLLVWPTAVFLNRGNHEDEYLCEQYGFINELRNKYQRNGRRLYRLFFDVFAWLPLASIIDERIFVTHGGISDMLDLDVVRKLERRRFASPVCLKFNPEPSIDPVELMQVLDLLWSDPGPQPGCHESRRGSGHLFGPDVTADFLKRHGLSMIIRSHQALPTGFEFCHRNAVLTVFSASNYYGEVNHGAYVKLDSSGKPLTVQFQTNWRTKLSINEKITDVEEGALRGLQAKIAASKTELVNAFLRLDPDRTGSVTVADWSRVMESTLMLELPWRTLRPNLAEVNGEGGVMYMSTFERVAIQLRIGGGKTGETGPTSLTTEIMYKNKEKLETIFRMMDKNSTGYISIEEFKECCRTLSRATQRQISEEEVTDMANMMDFNGDGHIDFNEFLEAFRIVDLQQKQPQSSRK